MSEIIGAAESVIDEQIERISESQRRAAWIIYELNRKKWIISKWRWRGGILIGALWICVVLFGLQRYWPVSLSASILIGLWAEVVGRLEAAR